MNSCGPCSPRVEQADQAERRFCMDIGHADVNSAIQDEIRAAWSEALGIEAPGLDDNFFELGGDSVRIVLLYARLQRDLGNQLTLTDLFQFPTIAAQARRLQPEPVVT